MGVRFQMQYKIAALKSMWIKPYKTERELVVSYASEGCNCHDLYIEEGCDLS